MLKYILIINQFSVHTTVFDRKREDHGKSKKRIYLHQRGGFIIRLVAFFLAVPVVSWFPIGSYLPRKFKWTKEKSKSRYKKRKFEVIANKMHRPQLNEHG